MNVKDAVRLATTYVFDLFKDEEISNVGLEEVEFDDVAGKWTVTIGFSRPWDYPKNTMAALSGEASPSRSYKIVTIVDSSEEVTSIKNKPKNV